MIRLVQWLFWGHVHKWKIIREHNIQDSVRKTPVAINYVSQCEKCGKLRFDKEYAE